MNEVPLGDELKILKTRNFMFKENSDYIEECLSNPTDIVKKKTLSIEEIIGNTEKPKLIEKTVYNKEEILSLIRKMKLDHLIRSSYNNRKKNNDRLKALLSKAEVRKSSLAEEEVFFQYNLGKKGENLNGHFDNLTKRTDLLYNLKAFFPVEKKYLGMLEKRAITKNLSNVQCYTTHKKKPSFSEKRLMKPEEIVCQVCNSGDYQDKNLIVFCSLCNVSTHQLCYGMQKVPKEDWLCDLCVQFGPKGKYLRCWLCNCRGGVLKQTEISSTTPFLGLNENYKTFLDSKPQQTDPFIPDIQQVKYPVTLLYDFYKESFKFSEEELVDEPNPSKMWIHSSCALWNPSINIKDNALRGFESVPLFSFLKTCRVCGSSIGACVKCSHDNCNIYFHVECGRRVKLFMEIFGTNNPIFFMYCAGHTPLTLKTDLETSDNRIKEEIAKFLRHTKRFLKTYKVDLTGSEGWKKGKIKGKIEKGVKIKKEPDELVELLDYDSRCFLMHVGHELYKKKDYQTTIEIKKQEGSYIVNDVILAKKKVQKHHVPLSAAMWKIIAAKYNTTVKTVYGRYSEIKSTLRNLSRNHHKLDQTLIDHNKMNSQEELFEPNNENFDDQLYCVCRKEWKGELMIECDRCSEWYHPKCINTNITNEIEINNNHILCFRCMQEYQEDYREDIELIQKEGEETTIKLRKSSLEERTEKLDQERKINVDKDN